MEPREPETERFVMYISDSVKRQIKAAAAMKKLSVKDLILTTLANEGVLIPTRITKAGKLKF